MSNKSKCCGKECLTVYCPHCGKPQDNSATAELFRYIANAVNIARKTLDKRMIRLQTSIDEKYKKGIEVHSKRVQMSEKSVAKYERMEQALKALMEGIKQ